MTEDESDVFEITDFTTASEWERFIAKLEEIIHEWKLNSAPVTQLLGKEEITAGTWKEVTENLQFADFKFVVTRHTLTQSGDGSKTEGTLQKEADKCRKEDEEQTNTDSGQSEGDEDKETERVPLVWQDMMSAENDFPGRCHCLCRWYGLRDFVVISPGNNMEDITSESRANLVMSSVAIALQNTSCVVPVFLQVHQRWRRLFLGQCNAPSFRTVFEMVHLRSVPHQYSHMAGLLDVFKAKIATPVSPQPPVSVAVRFTYVLQDWINYSWPQLPPDMDSFSAREVGVTEFGDLPYGPCEDPINELHLSATWPSLSEEMIVDNDVYSDLDPLQAPHWCVRVRMSESPQCLLGDYLSEFVQLCRRKESIDQLLGKSMRESEGEREVNVSNALNRLTEPVPYNLPSIGTVVTRATSKLQMKPEEAPIPTDMLNEILVFIFPDAKAELKGTSKRSSADQTSDQMTKSLDNPDKSSLPSSESNADLGKYTELFKQFKSAPQSSISYRLAVCMCIVNHSHGGLRAVAHLWQEFVLEMRYRWENKILVPDLDQGSPNTGCSLMHQKLQMLNCCIERKKVRESQSRKRSRHRLHSVSSTASIEDDPDRSRNDGSLSSDDEFFECMETTEESIKMDTINSSADSKSDSATVDETSLNTASGGERELQEAEGRLKPYGELRLLNVDVSLFEPVTQEPAPMTEDMLEEHAEVLAKLGTSAEGATLRARMQSACLLSDMESFKAANPGCTLGDFVRWYSPRDWIEEEHVDEDGVVSVKGQLSPRMQIPGNVWLEVWQSAKSVPAHRQRRLFDDTKEAEKVLHWLSALKPAEVALRLMPMLTHAAFTKLLEQEESHLPTTRKLLTQISSKAAKAMRAPRMEVKLFEDLVRHITMAEVVITRAQSLLAKFQQEKGDLDLARSDLERFVSDLLDLPDVEILGAAKAPLGTIIHRLFSASQKNEYLLPEDDDESEKNTLISSNDTKPVKIPDFPSPVGKEYILRTMSQRPAPWSRSAPQRMFCVLQRDNFRLAGSFSSDTTFQ